MLTFTVIGELASGTPDMEFFLWEELFNRFPVLEWNKKIAWQYGRLFRELKASGRMIGTNDLWIAATALVHHLPLVTRNVDDFSRVDGLEVVAY